MIIPCVYLKNANIGIQGKNCPMEFEIAKKVKPCRDFDVFLHHRIQLYINMSDVLASLKKGDLRTIGESDRVAEKVLRHPELLEELLSGLESEDTGVCMRASDAAEKVSAARSGIFSPHIEKLIKIAQVSTQQEVQWHLAQILPRLDLTDVQRDRTFHILVRFLNTTKSRIVETFSLQALADVAIAMPVYRKKVTRLIKSRMNNGSPAVIARGRKLLQLL
jgi:hypothetical protein